MGHRMICCLLMTGLGLLGPRGARLYRAFRKIDAQISVAQPPQEVATSGHLVMTSSKQQEYA